jgi:hypothetical protein
VARGSSYRSRRPEFDSRNYQIFWKDLERGPLSLVSTTPEQFKRNNVGSGLESREHGRGDPPRWPRGTIYPQKLALTSPTSGGRSVGIVRSQAKTTEFVFCFVNMLTEFPWNFLVVEHKGPKYFHAVSLWCEGQTRSANVRSAKQTWRVHSANACSFQVREC